MAWQNPKTDWAVNPKNPVPEDFNRIEGNIDFLKGDIETKKGAIVNALNTVGLETQLTDTHAQIANKIVAANQGTKIYTPSTVNQPIPKGFHSGQGYVKGDSNLQSSNIKKGVSIFGISGSYVGNQPVEGNAETSHVLAGKTFSSEVAGIGVTGTMPNRGAVVITPGTSNQTIQAGYHSGQGYVKGDANLKSQNIIKGKSIFGIAGSADRVATGSGTVSHDNKLTVRNLSFTPSIVYIRAIMPYDSIYYGQMIEWGLGGAGRSSLWVRSGGGNTGAIDSDGSITIQSGGFDASFYETIYDITAYWIAIG